MRTLLDKTVLVTGATDGLGHELAHELAQREATVLLHGRDEGKAQGARGAIAEATGSDRLHVLVADLSSLDAVRGLTSQVESSTERLDALVNNAGIISDERRESADGHELTFAVNYLSHFLLTALVLPLLRGSVPSRIVNVASIGQQAIDFGDLMLERGFEPMRAYSQSKLAQISFTFELAERLRAAGEHGVTVNALHPATLMDTKMVRQSLGRARTTVAEGVEATLRLVASDELDGVSGRYFDGLEESSAEAQAYDANARRELWARSEELTGISFDI
jgi:NAD(P)-dependent dehydrogenase (short-subunit alcohol dehydrogenase family)